MGLSTSTVLIFTYILYVLLLNKKNSLLVIKLEKLFVIFFFLCVLLSTQCTGYIIDENLLKKKEEKCEKCMENMWKKMV